MTITDDVPVIERGITPTCLPPRSTARATTKITGRVYPVTGYDTSRIPRTPFRSIPKPANDNDRAIFGRAPTARDSKTAAEGTQLEQEFKRHRLPRDLWVFAGDFVDIWEQAHRPPVSGTLYADAVSSTISPERLTGHERLAHAIQTLRFLQCRLGHLYAPLVDAAVMGRTMEEIGIAYGARKPGEPTARFRESAPAIGREKVVDALRFVREALWDLRTFAAEDEAAIASDAPIVPRVAFALGRKSGDLPTSMHEAANDNLRRRRAA